MDRVRGGRSGIAQRRCGTEDGAGGVGGARNEGGCGLTDDAHAVGGPVDEGGFAVDEVAIDGAEVGGGGGDGAVVAHDEVLAVGDDHFGHGARVAKTVGDVGFVGGLAVDPDAA